MVRWQGGRGGFKNYQINKIIYRTEAICAVRQIEVARVSRSIIHWLTS
jgi:hypothetical protein